MSWINCQMVTLAWAHPDEDGEWVFTGDSHVAHQRNDNSRYKWYYDSSTGEFGDRVAY